MVIALRFYLAKLIITTETTFSFTLMVEISTKSISESKKNKDFVLVSNSNKFFSSFNWQEKNKKIVFKPCAKKIANAVFSGYGQNNKSLIYHHTYYE